MTQTVAPRLLTSSQRSTLRRSLERDRAQINADIDVMLGDLNSFRDSRRDNANDDEHDPEGPTIAFEQSQSVAVLGQSRRHLEQVESAITRLDDGRYGACEGCGNPIPYARLSVRPYAAHCVQCAERAGR